MWLIEHMVYGLAIVLALSLAASALIWAACAVGKMSDEDGK